MNPLDRQRQLQKAKEENDKSRSSSDKQHITKQTRSQQALAKESLPIGINSDRLNSFLTSVPAASTSVVGGIIFPGVANQYLNGLGVWVTGSLGTGSHSALTNLTYGTSGHTGFSPTIHNLVDTVNHPVTGLSTGYFLRATSATTYDFTALTASDVIDALSTMFVIEGTPPNEYVRCLYPFASDYEIQAFTNGGWLPGSWWDSLPTAKSIVYNPATSGYLELDGDELTPTDGYVYGYTTLGGKGWYAQTGGTVSPLTTKGDVYTYSTVNDRLPVGADNYVLTADALTATGLKWAANVSSQWTTSGSDIYYSGGKVGVGIAPDSLFHISSTSTQLQLSDSGAAGDGDKTVSIYAARTGTGKHNIEYNAYYHTWKTGSTITGMTLNTVGALDLTGDLDVGNTTDGSITTLTGKNTVSYTYTLNTKVGNYLRLLSNKPAATGIYFDPDGNVGINTASPLAKLVISYSSGGNGIEFQPFSSSTQITSYDRSTSAYKNLNLYALGIGINMSASYPLDVAGIARFNTYFLTSNSVWALSGGVNAGQSGVHVWHDSATKSIDPLGFGVAINRASGCASYINAQGGAYALLVDTGNVGIGTLTPQKKFHVAGDMQVNGYYKVSDASNNLYAYFGDFNYIFGSGNHMACMYMATGNNFAFMNGNVGVKTTNPSCELDVVGAIRASSEITAYYSDMRLKTNIKPITNAIDKIKKLHGFTYYPNGLANTLVKTQDIERKVGVSAQDVQEVLPEAVKLAPFDIDENGKSKSGENYLTVQYEKIVPLLIEAIKELQQEIEELKNG